MIKEAIMDATQVKELIRQELPNILKTDDTFRYILQGILQENCADKQKTEDHIDQILAEMREERKRNQAEMRALREESERRWIESNAKWDAKWDKQQAEMRALREESERKWAESNAKWAESNAKWAESNAKWDVKWDKQQAEMRALREESERKWAESNAKWSESNAKWDAKWDKQQAEIRALREETLLFIRRYDSSIGALGARWGLQSESAFRNALKSILEKSFDVKVLNINDFDHEGIVFGRPDQIELDIIIKNGLVVICEIKSSISKSDMYIFERKVRFYEKQHQKTANRLVVISPMVDKYAYPVAENLGIEVYSHAENVNPIN